MQQKINNLRDIVLVLIEKELKIRYKSHAFGYLWSIANPLTYGLIYFFIFKLVMRVKLENFPLFLVAGLFPWQWFSNSIGVAPMTYLGNASLIKKINFPRNILPFVVTIQDLIHFLISFPIILIFMYIFDVSPTWSWLYGIPFLLVSQLIYCYSIGLVISTVNLFFRDMEKIIQILMTLLFYATPIVYSQNMIPQKFKFLLYVNPIAPLMISWRSLITEGSIDSTYLGLIVFYCTVFLIISKIIYEKLSWRFAEVL